MEESGAAMNSEISSTFSCVYDNDGSQPASLIPIAIGVAVVGFLIFSKNQINKITLRIIVSNRYILYDINMGQSILFQNVKQHTLER